MQLKESRILLTIGIQNPNPTDRESTAWNPQSKTVLNFLTWGESFNMLHPAMLDKVGPTLSSI